MRRYVIAVATAGEKALAGPLVAAALILDEQLQEPKFAWPGTGGLRRLNLVKFDNVPDAKRTKAARWFRENSEGAGSVVCTAHQLSAGATRQQRRDALGRAVRRAVEHAIFRYPNFRMRPDSTSILVFGNDLIHSKYVGSQVIQETYVPSREKPWQLYAAYAVAKERRDQVMYDAAEMHPDYHFAVNHGYNSPEHREALRVQGPTPFHRTTSALVRASEVSL